MPWNPSPGWVPPKEGERRLRKVQEEGTGLDKADALRDGCNLHFCHRGKEGEKGLDSLLNG
jgi:hypothetical protein